MKKFTIINLCIVLCVTCFIGCNSPFLGLYYYRYDYYVFDSYVTNERADKFADMLSKEMTRIGLSQGFYRDCYIVNKKAVLPECIQNLKGSRGVIYYIEYTRNNGHVCVIQRRSGGPTEYMEEIDLIIRRCIEESFGKSSYNKTEDNFMRNIDA